MIFAVNYSPIAASLLKKGRIEIDRFKCPEWPDVVNEARKVKTCYVHFGFRAGMGELEKVDWSLVDRLMVMTDTTDINIHLAPRASDFGGMALESRDPNDHERVVAAMQGDVDALCGRFGAERVVVENVMWDPDPPWLIPAIALDADVISQVTRESCAGFVLDLAHAFIAARHFGQEPKAYIQKLPVEQLRELHITGVIRDEAGLLQDHYPMMEEMWELFDWAIERIRLGEWARPRMVTFEYGGVGEAYEHRTDPKVLAGQIPRLRERLSGV